MAIKNTDIFLSLLSSCDELRGGMDANQYKDYVLVMLFIKYVSDKYAGQPHAPITIPDGASFADMVALKGKTTIGDDINKKIIAPLANANNLSGMPDFNDPGTFGSGKEMVDKLTNLISTFENPTLDFSKNRADDDILGDAYEYLMHHFAKESGKGMGQFYIPSEIRRIIAKVIGVPGTQTTTETTVYDPTCGYGLLLSDVAKEANGNVTLYGQERYSTIAGLAQMSMILHNSPTAEIVKGDVLASPRFLENGNLKKFNYVVACPPLGLRHWSSGFDPQQDSFNRFIFGIPPKQHGDFAFIQHMIASLKPEGRMAVLIPHGSLFRGGAEATIRQAILEADIVEAIIGLPANLLSSTSIPVCILVCSMHKAKEHTGKVLFINADRDFDRSKRKNILQLEHVNKIVDTFYAYSDVEQFSRVVSVDEIRNNKCNLNIPRYVDSSELAALLKQYCDKFNKYQIKDLALEINSVGKDKDFEERANAIFVPKILGPFPTTDVNALSKSHHDYYQVILNNKAINHYVAQFLCSTIGKHALSVLANNAAIPSFNLATLNEVTIALPSLEQQQSNVETHQKLLTLKESIEKINQELSLNPTSSLEFEAQLDSMLKVVGELSEADQVRSAMRQGESKTVEFKETFSLCVRQQTKEKHLETSVLKTIVAFLNSEGGTLLIGVSDAPQIVGIEPELKKFHKNNEDKFLSHMKNKLKDRIGEKFYPFINYDLIEVDGIKLVNFQCQRSDSPCFLDSTEFYVRTNPASDKIEGQKMIDYLQNHFNTTF